jgi:hypothetical protein
LFTRVDVVYEQAEFGQFLADQVTATTTRKYSVAPAGWVAAQVLSLPAGRQHLPTYQFSW